MATTGVLFRKLLKNATGQNIRLSAARDVLGLPNNVFTSKSIAPEACIPAATTNIPATVIKPELLKPLNASALLRMPVTLSIVNAPSIIKCGPMRVKMSVTNTATHKVNVNQPCHSIAFKFQTKV